MMGALRIFPQGTTASGGRGGLYASVKSTCPAMSKVHCKRLEFGSEPFLGLLTPALCGAWYTSAPG